MRIMTVDTVTGVLAHRMVGQCATDERTVGIAIAMAVLAVVFVDTGDHRTGMTGGTLGRTGVGQLDMILVHIMTRLEDVIVVRAAMTGQTV